MARLLVVDDEAQIVTALTRGLEREGYDVEASRTGLDAVALTAAGSPDLIVLDLNLPDIDGIEVLRRVRTWSQVPVLVLSGDGEETLQTLRAHLRSLRRKLGDDSKEPRFIRTETRIGYRWVAPVAPAAREAGGTVAGG